MGDIVSKVVSATRRGDLAKVKELTSDLVDDKNMLHGLMVAAAECNSTPIVLYYKDLGVSYGGSDCEIIEAVAYNGNTELLDELGVSDYGTMMLVLKTGVERNNPSVVKWVIDSDMLSSNELSTAFFRSVRASSPRTATMLAKYVSKDHIMVGISKRLCESKGDKEMVWILSNMK